MPVTEKTVLKDRPQEASSTPDSLQRVAAPADLSAEPLAGALSPEPARDPALEEWEPDFAEARSFEQLVAEQRDFQKTVPDPLYTLKDSEVTR